MKKSCIKFISIVYLHRNLLLERSRGACRQWDIRRMYSSITGTRKLQENVFVTMRVTGELGKVHISSIGVC